jgi:hypothetical protein
MDEQRHTVDETADSETVRSESAMRARRWAIAATREPGAYGIPELPVWDRVDGGEGIAFAREGETEPFISADEPTKVRR